MRISQKIYYGKPMIDLTLFDSLTLSQKSNKCIMEKIREFLEIKSVTDIVRTRTKKHISTDVSYIIEKSYEISLDDDFSL